MDILEIKYKAAIARLKSLDETFGFIAECKGTDLENAMNDSSIMSHRWAIDATVNFCETYLLEHLELAVRGGSRHGVLTEAYDANVITQEEYAQLLMSVKDRNISPQLPEDNRACGIIDRIPEHYPIMKAVVDKLHVQIMNVKDFQIRKVKVMDTGIDPKDKEKIIGLISVLAPKAKIILFGARARGRFSTHSEIELILDMGEIIPSLVMYEISEVLSGTTIIHRIEVMDICFARDFERYSIDRDGIVWKV